MQQFISRKMKDAALQNLHYNLCANNNQPFQCTKDYQTLFELIMVVVVWRAVCTFCAHCFYHFQVLNADV